MPEVFLVKFSGFISCTHCELKRTVIATSNIYLTRLPLGVPFLAGDLRGWHGCTSRGSFEVVSFALRLTWAKEVGGRVQCQHGSQKRLTLWAQADDPRTPQMCRLVLFWAVYPATSSHVDVTRLHPDKFARAHAGKPLQLNHRAKNRWKERKYRLDVDIENRLNRIGFLRRRTAGGAVRQRRATDGMWLDRSIPFWMPT